MESWRQQPVVFWTFVLPGGLWLLLFFLVPLGLIWVLSFGERAGPVEVVITGTLPGVSREEAARRLEAAGAKVASAVSRKTDFLLAGEAAGSKLEKAKSLGVRTVTWDEMIDILEGGG